MALLRPVCYPGVPPQTAGLWVDMTSQTNTTETASPSPIGTKFGPYLQSPPMNNWNNLTGVSSAAVDMGAGWYYSCSASTAELRVRNPDGSVNYNY